MIKELGVFEYHPQQWDRFVAGELWRSWAENYPDIFDERDIQIAKTQAGPSMRLHFHEWLAAVLLFQSYGYLSLVEQYEFKAQQRKQAVIKRLLPSNVFELVTNHNDAFGKVQCPDLLCFSPDYSDWFFCEVKGPRDRLRESQIRFFDELERVSGKKIRVIRFQSAV
ncbi:MAG: VRR-NUC domain-containing protein [Chloroflexi bacterium]|nr:VRR-NUC domain-containing protein [Chloroflexota bacterium]